MHKLPSRQVHLDFHTSADCEHVGADFDPGRFARTFRDAHVNSVTVFAKCHHGFSYYPTEVGTQHPHLDFDLLGAQIEALHRHGIRAPIYISVMWDDLAGQQHPEWIAVDREGKLVGRPPLSGKWGWTTMDLASGYRGYFMAQVAEICDRYPADGFFFDICYPLPNYSPQGKAQMLAAGVNPEDAHAAWEFARRNLLAFFDEVSALVRRKLPGEPSIFYNSTVSPRMRETLSTQTHFEIESLPTAGQWGYLHYPVMARQARTYGRDFLGMTGRFHGTWGDFGGLKTRDQLDYECGVILAAGGKISVGDQLHPRGILDPAVYRLIGHAFARVENLEPWLEGASPTAEVAILSLDSANATSEGDNHPPGVQGAAQMLLEMGRQFDILDPAGDFSRYPALLLPDSGALPPALTAKFEDYLASGGRLILSGTSALDAETRRFQLTAIPAAYLEPASTRPCYLRPGSPLPAGSELAADYDYAFYGQAQRVRPAPDAKPWGEMRAALFNRTWAHFVSHQHAPVGELLNTPVAVRNEQVLYFAAPLFAAYREHDYWAYRAMAQSLLEAFLPPPLLKAEAPGWVTFTLHQQPAGEGRPARQILHISAYHPRRTWQRIPHADQSALTAGLRVSVRREEPAQRVYRAPSGEKIDYAQDKGYLQIELPPVGVHTVVVIE
jgi:hypothetical protein